ncbi:Ig-like domain-containing protein [Paenibacillus swuensis]|nr:Ig-like domain-containing protein [Paenibacillus swuensis]
MIKMQQGGTAPVISYNVPEPTTYSGRNFIDLQLPDGYFLQKKQEVTVNGISNGAQSPSTEILPSAVETLRFAQESGERLTTGLANLTAEEVLRKEETGEKLNIVRTMTGALAHNFIARDTQTEPVFTSGPAEEHLPIFRAPQEPNGSNDGGMAQMLPPRDTEDPFPEEDPISVSVSISSPAANAVIQGIHTGAVVDIRGTAFVDSGLGSIKYVSVTIGTSAAKTASLSANGDWVLSGVVLANPGQTNIYVKAMHTNGKNSAARQIVVTVQLAQAPDVTIPTVNITSPASSSIASKDGAVSANVTIEGTASDDRGISKVELIVNNGTPVQAESTNNFQNWKKTITIPQGSNSLVVNAYDAAGNKGTASKTLLIDTTIPAIGITSPVNAVQIAGTQSQGAMVEILGTATDASGIERVEITTSGNPVPIRASENATGDWSKWKATLSFNATEKVFITAKAYDKAGNFNEKTIEVNVSIIPEVNSRLKRIILVESYRLTSYLANYGAGRTIKTFSLLPGEKSKISIKSYSQNETTMKSASTILDSVTDDISIEFENSIAKEQSDKKNYSESNDYKLEATAGVSWGWGSASLSASTSGGTNSAREQFAKNVVNNTQKHVSKASARRDVQINTTYEEKNTTSEESSIVREIENINVSRTLNFVFRQMNQEFLTFLHLVDVRIGFFETFVVGENKYREVTLPQLDALIKDTIIPEKRVEVRNAILYQLLNVFDYQDRHHAFVEEEPFKDRNGQDIPLSHYLRVKKDYVTEYVDEASGTAIEVPGIILAANRNVLRTEGIVVEALLGQGEALDDYSRNLQAESVREKELRNDLLEMEIKMKKLALEILDNKDTAAAELYRMLTTQSTTQQQPEEEARAEALVR